MKRTYIYIIMCSLLATSLHAQEGFGTYLRNIIQKQEKGILVTAKLIEACGLCDSLDVTMDNEYENMYQKKLFPLSFTNTWGIFDAPEHRYYGYTLFAETDEFWENTFGKNYKAITVADVAAYVKLHCQFTKNYSNDKNYSNPKNMLYQFVTYHLLNRTLTAEHLTEHANEVGYVRPRTDQPAQLGVAVCDYYTTMGDRRLLRTYESAESEGIFLNRIPRLDNRRDGTYHELSCDNDKVGIRIDTENMTDTLNAVIYPIHNLLAFDKATAQNMGNIRLRIDVASIFPEMATNDMILKQSSKAYYFPNEIYPYLEDLTVNNYDTKFCYWTGYSKGWKNMREDEIACWGLQDITLRLPPVPKDGIYELRLGLQSHNNRGIFNIYYGTDPDNLSPLGMPVDFRQKGNTRYTSSGYISNYIGYEADINDDDYYNQMLDNEFHENGYMKGCMQYCAGGSGTSTTMRNSDFCLRHILGRLTMDADKTYFIRFKTVMDNPNTELYLDYIEFCPKSVYDNPDEPEDIW